MAQFFRKSVRCSSGIKNGHIALRQGDWFQFEGDAHYTAEFMDNFYCCRQVERSKMKEPQEWQLDLYAFPAPPSVSFCYVPALRNDYFASLETAMGFAAPLPVPNASTALTSSAATCPASSSTKATRTSCLCTVTARTCCDFSRFAATFLRCDCDSCCLGPLLLF